MTAAVGIDVGGSNLKAVRLVEGEVDVRERMPTPSTPDAILSAVAEVAARLGPGLPVGVGLAGLVDHLRGVLVWAPHLPGEEVAFAAPLRRRLGVDVTVDNDANLAALGEHEIGRRRGTTATLTIGTGIGLGIVVDGHIFHGAAHAGEVGHITVEPGGERCPCGRRGCWETRISGRRLDADAAEVLGPGAGAADLVDAARRGDRAAGARLDEAAGWLAWGIEALVLAYDPDEVVVGGGVAGAGNLLLEPVRRRLAATEGAGRRPSIPVGAGILGPDAGAVGAAMAAVRSSEGTK
ncbi:MAG TPA: ROK family protein [Acidimicrobiia bacterium]|nr:ROK family protein [Acidimicrobiia bacterium]